MISKEKENKIIEMYQHDYTYDEIMAAEEIKANTIAAVLRGFTNKVLKERRVARTRCQRKGKKYEQE